MAEQTAIAAHIAPYGCPRISLQNLSFCHHFKRPNSPFFFGFSPVLAPEPNELADGFGVTWVLFGSVLLLGGREGCLLICGTKSS